MAVRLSQPISVGSSRPSSTFARFPLKSSLINLEFLSGLDPSLFARSALKPTLISTVVLKCVLSTIPAAKSGEGERFGKEVLKIAKAVMYLIKGLVSLFGFAKTVEKFMVAADKVIPPRAKITSVLGMKFSSSLTLITIIGARAFSKAIGGSLFLFISERGRSADVP